MLRVDGSLDHSGGSRDKKKWVKCIFLWFRSEIKRPQNN